MYKLYLCIFTFFTVIRIGKNICIYIFKYVYFVFLNSNYRAAYLFITDTRIIRF